ncbi:MAG: 3-oxoacid CoA-transferase subunit A [Propionibacteriaceae bacterium]|nr:3-oxoacid CoA-transferase subunit A [Propionibacteriaceae bacterium]
MGLRSKVKASPTEALAGLEDGMTLHVGGWGGIGVPDILIRAIAASGIRGLTISTNNCGMGRPGDVGELFAAGCVKKVLTTFPVHASGVQFKERLDAGEVELEIVPQGTLAERLRAAGAGLGGFYTPTSVGTPLAEGKETRVINGREYVLEMPLHADFAIIRAVQADTFGNLRFRYANRGFNPVMAQAGKVTIVQADEVVQPGAFNPDDVHLPGIFVDRIVVTGAQQ